MMGFDPIAAMPISATRLVGGVLGAVLLGTASLTVGVDSRICAATAEMITQPTDRLPNTPFLGTLQKAIRFDRSIVNGGRIGQVTVGWGDIELINAEGDYDGLIERFAVDGRRVVVRVGLFGQPYDSYLTLLDATAADWAVAEDVLRVQIRDNGYRLDVPAQPLLYGGTGGLDGTADLAGKRMPLALGACLNVTPVDLIPNLLVRQVHSGQIQAIPAVYDGAVALTLARDYSSAAQLVAATTGAAGSGAEIEAGRYATCLAAGLLRLGGQPAGTVTCDVRGDATAGLYTDTTAGLVRRLATTSAGLSDPAGLNTASFQAVDAAQSSSVGYWLDGGTDRSVADVIADLMGGVGGWGGVRRDGRLEVGIFTAPDGVPVARYDRVDIVEITRDKLPSDLSPPPWRWRVAYGRNYTVQTDVEGRSGVTAARAAFLKEGARLVASDATAGARIRANHPLAQDPAQVEGFFVDASAAQTEADRLLALYGTARSLYRITLKIQPFTHEIGEVVHVTYPRWDLTAGRLLRIVAITDDTDEDRVEIVGFG